MGTLGSGNDFGNLGSIVGLSDAEAGDRCCYCHRNLSSSGIIHVDILGSSLITGAYLATGTGVVVRLTQNGKDKVILARASLETRENQNNST